MSQPSNLFHHNKATHTVTCTLPAPRHKQHSARRASQESASLAPWLPPGGVSILLSVLGGLLGRAPPFSVNYWKWVLHLNSLSLKPHTRSLGGTHAAFPPDWPSAPRPLASADFRAEQPGHFWNLPSHAGKGVFAQVKKETDRESVQGYFHKFDMWCEHISHS